MCGHTRDLVICSKFHRNPFRGFGAPGGQNLASPITLATRFYNSLYYRTSRDSERATIFYPVRHVAAPVGHQTTLFGQVHQGGGTGDEVGCLGLHLVLYCTLCVFRQLRVVAQRVKRWTCDQQVQILLGAKAA